MCVTTTIMMWDCGAWKMFSIQRIRANTPCLFEHKEATKFLWANLIDVAIWQKIQLRFTIEIFSSSIRDLFVIWSNTVPTWYILCTVDKIMSSWVHYRQEESKTSSKNGNERNWRRRLARTYPTAIPPRQDYLQTFYVFLNIVSQSTTRERIIM